MAVVTERYGTFRAEDLLNPEVPEKFVEIIEGELVVTLPAGRFHNRICFRFARLFQLYCETSTGLDYGGSNEGFLLEQHPDVLLSPDACLFRKREDPDNIWMEFAPEVAVEVLSPSNTGTEMAYKMEKYFGAGSEQVWIADPEKESIEFYYSDGRRVRVEGDEIVEGEGIAEGMKIDLPALFERS